MDSAMHLLNTPDTQDVNKSKRVVSIGDAVKQLMDNHVSPRQDAVDSIIELWRRILPAEFVQHSRIADISSGRLKVQVDSPSYMYELQLCSSGLLGEIQRQCPKVRLKEIKFVLV
jgi:hypothetical protein